MEESERKVLYYTHPALNRVDSKGPERSLPGGSRLRRGGGGLSPGMTSSGTPSLAAPSVRVRIFSLVFLVFLSFFAGTTPDPI